MVYIVLLCYCADSSKRNVTIFYMHTKNLRFIKHVYFLSTFFPDAPKTNLLVYFNIVITLCKVPKRTERDCYISRRDDTVVYPWSVYNIVWRL